MAANLPAEYYTLQGEYQGAKSREEKIRILEQMLSAIPQHKCSQKVRGELRRRISLLKKEIEIEKKKKGAAARVGIKKEGAAQVVLVGPTNTGKSYIMNKLCNKWLPSTELPFETKVPVVGMMNYHGINIQLVEIPSIYPGFYEKNGEARGLIYSADALVFCIKEDKDLQLIKSEIELRNRPFLIHRPYNDLERFRESVWKMIGMIKIYTKIPGKAVEKRPVALKKGAAIKDLADEIHKDFIKKFKYAKVIRPESRIKERHVGLKFILEDNDIVELHTK
jgi:hypothetical protein